MSGDDFIQLRLRESWLIPLVVTIFTVGEQIDEDIDVEHLTELKCQLRHIDHRLDVVAVHVKHRRLGHLGHVRTVGAGAALKVTGGEAHLVVDHNMDRATCLVALQL